MSEWQRGRKGQGLRDAVRDDGVVDVVSRVLELGTLLVQAGYLDKDVSLLFVKDTSWAGRTG